MNRTFAPQTTRTAASNTLASRLTAERLPLDLALSLAVELVKSVADAHQQRRSFTQLTAADFVVLPDGAFAVTAPSLISSSTDTSADAFAVGAVLYRLFTGLSPSQARARLAVSPLHEVPLASQLNPAIDDTLEGVLSMMLERDPALRPHSLRVIEALLVDVCESLELEPSRAAILHWASIAPTLRVVQPPAPLKPAAKRHVPTFVVMPDEDLVGLDEEDDAEEASPVPLRFDIWAVAACAFCVVAFAMATHL